MPELSELIERWLGKLELAGKAERTRESYAWQIERLARWADPRTVDGLQLEDLERYVLERKHAGINASTLGVAVCAFKSFYRLIGSPVAEGLKSPVVKDRAQRTLTESEVEAVLASIDTSTVKGKRDLALIGLLVATGLRAAEICNVRLKDIDFDRRIFKVVVKGGKTQEKWLDEYAVNLVLAWMAARAEVVQPGVETLFVGLETSIADMTGGGNGCACGGAGCCAAHAGPYNDIVAAIEHLKRAISGLEQSSREAAPRGGAVSSSLSQAGELAPGLAEGALE